MSDAADRASKKSAERAGEPAPKKERCDIIMGTREVADYFPRFCSTASGTLMQDLKIEQIPIRALLPYARNARTHSRRQIRKIAKSIEKFGFVNPILISDELTIIAGHGRVEAAKLLGFESVPAVRLSRERAA